jgi:hypothetical protein
VVIEGAVAHVRVIVDEAHDKRADRPLIIQRIQGNLSLLGGKEEVVGEKPGIAGVFRRVGAILRKERRLEHDPREDGEQRLLDVRFDKDQIRGEKDALEFVSPIVLQLQAQIDPGLFRSGHDDLCGHLL